MSHLITPKPNQTYLKSDLGGKAYHLMAIQAVKLRVPPFFVIPTYTVNSILSIVQPSVNNLVLNIKKDTPKANADFAQKIQDIILNITIPKLIQDEIENTLNTSFDKNTRFAVRSSGTAEDGANASFAGQHATYLFVETANIIYQIKACIASAWNFGALTYRLEKGIAIQNIKIAVVVQQMVRATKSGVSFSMNLQGNLADTVIVAGYGSGEGIVTDQVETDTFIVNRQHQHILKNILPKKSQLVFEANKGLINADVPLELASKATLSDEEIIHVFELTQKAESLLSCPADIEFSFDKNGQLFLLQMRPITTINFDEVRILDNTNIVESYPEVTLPLSFSFALKAYEKVFTGSSKAFWVSKKVVEKDKVVFENLLAHYCGRVYYRLDNWYRMMSLVYSSPRSMEAWEKSVGLMNSEKNKVKFSFRNQLKTILSIVWLIINYKKGNRRFFTIFKKNYAFLRNIESIREQPKALWQHYEEATERLFKPWYLTIVNDFLAFKAFGWLQDFIKKYDIGKEELANDLLCGMGGVESEEAVLNVLRLKSEIINNQDSNQLFQKTSEDILKQLKQSEFEAFYQKFRHHCETYGDRTLAELKLETPSLRNQPILLISLLKNQLSSPINIQDFRKQQNEIKTKAELQIKSKLKWYQPKTYIFRFLRNLATYGLKNRENMRFCRTRGYGAVKDIFLAFGTLMVQKGDLKEAKDIFYLNIQDVKEWANVEKNQTINWSEKIIGVKEKYKNYKSIQLPDRVIYTSEQPSENLNIRQADNEQMNKNSNLLQGIPVSQGKVTSKAIVVLEPRLDTNVQGNILVSKMTDPGWVFLMTQAVGLISEKGSLLSHTAIVGRELGIPVVVNVPNATSILQTGELIELDGDAGTIRKMKN